MATVWPLGLAGDTFDTGVGFRVWQPRATPAKTFDAAYPCAEGSMTMPQWALLGSAVWTLLVLFGTVGVYRWSRILTGRVRISEWQADLPQGSDCIGEP